MAARLPILPATAWLLLLVAGTDALAQAPRLPTPIAGGSAEPYPRDPRLQPGSNYPRDGSQPAGTGQGSAPPTPAPAPPAAQPITGAPTGDALVDAATKSLANQVSIALKFRLETNLFGEQFIGAGTYLQTTSASRLWRLELLLRDGDEQSFYQQVCDGATLWFHQRVGELQELRIIELNRAKQSILAGSEDTGSPPIDWGAGGLPQMLASLRESFVFEKPRAGKVGEERAWRLRGRWRPEYLAALLPDQKGAILRGEKAKFDKLPEHIPDEVILDLRAADLFPLRVEYRRKPVLRFYEKLYRDDKPVSLTVLELFDIRLGMPIDPKKFEWRSGNIDVIDHTPEHVDDVQVLNQAVKENRATISTERSASAPAAVPR